MFGKMRTLIIFAALPGIAAEYEIDPAHSNAQFSVRHLTVSNVRGEFAKVTGSASFDPNNLQTGVLEATIDVNSIVTRDPKRDEHLKSADFFDVAKYPTLRFKSREFERANGRLRITGDLTIHGLTKLVVLDVDGPTPEIKDPWGGLRIGASATAKVNRKDFGLIWNAPLEAGGFVLGDDVAITLEVELVKKPAHAASNASH
jgi:polyisoprenoid-binding protein YceI